ncbi:MAG: S8 family serine peptidase [Candidatus Sericytochromatia bacterium]|nr:S8 family serine peptidase [Candidatus Sericytochromatia bacterium]
MQRSSLVKIGLAVLTVSASFSCSRFSVTQAARVNRSDQIAVLAARPEETVTPMSFNDPLLPEQGYIRHCRIDEAWQLTRGDMSLKVAVVDGRIDSAQDLSGRVIEERRWVDEAPPTHATPIAGIIGAIQGNGEGIAGISRCSIISEVAQTPANFPEAATAEAIEDAARAGAKVINCSFGTPTRSTRLEQAVNRAVSLGAVVVCAAMNEGNGVRYYPAAFDAALAVGSVDSADQASTFSNFGAWLSIAAPGEFLLTTFPGRSNHYDYFSGTSASAAVISGIIALMLSVNADLSPAEIKAILQQTTPNKGRFNPLVGYGSVDAYRAVRVAKGLRRQGESPKP